MLDQLLKSLNISPTILLWNIVVFLVLYKVLDVTFWRPMIAHIDRRKHDLDDAYKTVDRTRQEMEQLRAEYQARVAQIEAEARGQIQETVRDAQSQREKMISEARAQAEQIMQQGQESIDREREETLVRMRSSLDQVALAALSKATGAPASPTQSALVDEYIAQHVARS